jgi:rubredoxin
MEKKMKEDKFDYWCCPECGWNTCDHDGPAGDGVLLQVTEHCFHYDGSQSWTEHWKCPDCEEEFEVDNGT